MPIDETTEEEVDRRRSSIGSLTSSINSCSSNGDNIINIVERRGSYNNNSRLPPRRSKRFGNNNISVPQSTAAAAAAEQQSELISDQPSSTTNSVVNDTTTTTTKLNKQDSWKFNTDWEDVSYSGVYDSIASQSSLYHVLGVEQEEEEDVEDQRNYGRVLDDDNSDEEGNDKVVSLSDINNERSDSNFSCGGSSIPNRGVSRQLSAKSFRRSVQDTLKHDEDS